MGIKIEENFYRREAAEERMAESFRFYMQHNLVELLGLKAKNPVELLDNIRNVPAASIYYHTHRFILQHQYLSPEPPNDFALWLKDSIHLESLGEAFLDVDTVSFVNLEDLRAELIRILDGYISRGEYLADCPMGQEFDFMSCKIFVMPTAYAANNLTEFVEILSKISIHSLYFHMFEAPMRLKRHDNDFSAWFMSIGEEELAERARLLNPYNISLVGLRLKLIQLVKKYADSQ
ncbi:Uncharacterised protein [uncultured archaeon]|nr:Uncharacterised protein [uncultured archaeon]